MKKFFVAGCLLMFAFMVSAQGGGQGGGFNNPEFRQRMYDRLKTEVNLTDKQLEDIKKIDDEFYFPKMQEIAEKAAGDFEKMRTEMTKLNEERNEKVKPLLSEEQFTKYVEANTFRGGGPGGNRQN